MKAAALLLVFVYVKLAMLAGHAVPASPWTPFAYLWQDAAVALVFAAAERLLKRWPGAIWTLYVVLSLYAAINIPVARALSTPLTPPMLRAAGGALSDSLWHYVTWQNAVLFCGALALAAAGPLLFRRVGQKPALAALTAVVALGPASAAHIDTRGLDRNAWTALIGFRAPAIGPAAPAGWRASPFENQPQASLTQFRGAAARRNIVFVSLESTAAQYLGIYGARPDVMPNLSRLAREGIIFENAYAVYPESIKGLFSILCSAYPALGRTAEEDAALPCRSLAAVLSDAGYRTALFHSGRFGYLGMEAVIRDRGFETLEDAGDIGGNHQSSFGVDEPAAVTRILRWIDAVPDGRPFFVAYLPIAGHHPYETPEPGPLPEHDEIDRYRNALHYGDASLGALMEGLRTRGLEQKTLWVVIGDHGEAFGQHDGNYGHTFHLYEENVHVPLLVAAPGLIAQETRDRRVVSLVDTAPTVLALTGLAAPKSYQGKSVLDAEPRMALFFADYSLGLLGLRDGPYKLIYELNSGRLRLFDLDRDPAEKTNLSALDPRRARWYAQDLQSWSAAQRLRLAAVTPR